MTKLRNLVEENKEKFKENWNEYFYKSVTKAVDIWFTGEMLCVRLEDGREVGIPLEWFPRLIKATNEQRNNWRLIGNGVGIHWEDIDEDLSVQKLVQ